MTMLSSGKSSRIAAALLIAAFVLGTTVHLGHHSLQRSTDSDSNCLACQVQHTGALTAPPVALPPVVMRLVPDVPEQFTVFAVPQHRLHECRGPPAA